jgi:phosphohistidine phosphatase
MRRLILLRHAKTEPDAASGKDRDRRLDERGHEDAATIGGWLADNGLLPDIALISTATRAQQTWTILREQFPAEAPLPHVEDLQDLYGAGPAVMLQIIRDAPSEARRLLLVGHNPGLHELALALIGHQPQSAPVAMPGNLPTSGILVIDFATDDWGQVGFGDGRLQFYTSPKLLKAAAPGA